MRTRIASTAACLAIVIAAALSVPSALSQGRGGRGGAQPQRYVPIDNPAGRMTNPVQPIIQSPYLPHPAATPARESRRYERSGVVVGGVYSAPYYAPYYDYGYYDPLRPVITIPGLLPGARYEDYIDPRSGYSHAGNFNPIPDLPPEPAPGSGIYYPLDLRMIIREPQPNRVIQPPAVGTSRADVIQQFGQPWGSFKSRGIETLSFDGITVVFGPDGRVTSSRRDA